MMVRGDLDKPFVRSKTAGGVRPGLFLRSEINMVSHSRRSTLIVTVSELAFANRPSILLDRNTIAHYTRGNRLLS